MKKLNNKDIEIAVEIDGVYAQGFGMLAQKVMLEMDESDNISNQNCKRTKAVLCCFRKIKY